MEYLTGAKVVSGYPDGTFHPGAALSRGQAAKMLVRQRGLAADCRLSRRFSDVDATYRPYVETAADKGWITGYSDGTFRPYVGLQRQHMAVIMVRSLGWAEAAEALTAIADRGAAGCLQRRGRDRDRGPTLRGPGAGPRLVQGGRRRPSLARHVDHPGTVLARGLPGRTARSRGGRSDPGRNRPSGHDPGGLRSLRRAGNGHQSHERLQRAGDRCGEGGRRRAGEPTLSVGSPEVQRAATRQLSYRPQAVRITLTLDRFSRFEVATLPPSDGKGNRIVVDVFKRADGPPGSGPPLIALDAGHGGSDTGAIGVTGVKEKNINLAITLEVDRILREKGLRTMLTRSDDSYPTLQERTDLANQAQASIFVSIHNNAAGDPASEGTETFYWGTDAEYSVEGKRLAEAIQRNLIASLGSVDRGARTHWNNLHVLAESNMTAALTEVGFLTNAEEEAKLKDPAYQKKAAAAVARGILEYLGWSPSTAPAGG